MEGLHWLSRARPSPTAPRQLSPTRQVMGSLTETRMVSPARSFVEAMVNTCRNNKLAPLITGLLALCFWVPTVPTFANQAVVLSIGDGDTLTVTEGTKRVTVRLACIDAPETAQSPYGGESRKALQDLAPINTPVRLNMVGSDRYRRSVAEVFRGSTNINLSLVRRGYAFVYRDYLQNCDRSSYLGAEREAERNKTGVWAVPEGIMRPWDWRKGSRGQHASPRPNNSSTRSPSGRHTCGKIGDWKRAQQLLKEGHTYLDRDGDGEACEALR